MLKIIIAIILLFIFITFLQKKDKNEEYYSSVPYDECRKKGYTKEFCLKTPVSLFGPSVCMCKGGKVGRIIPGFKGKCICNESLMSSILHS